VNAVRFAYVYCVRLLPDVQDR